MLHKHVRLAAAASAIFAAGLAGYSLRPSNQTTKLAAARDPAAEVRTQVIRRTIHVVKHERSGQGPRHGHTLVVSGGGVHAGRGRTVSTRASHHSAVAGGTVASAPVATRASSHPVSSASTGGPASGVAPVTTRPSTHRTTGVSSGAPHSSGAPVTTRPSTRGSGSGSSGSSSKPVTTRASSGGGHGGGDGEGSHGHDD